MKPLAKRHRLSRRSITRMKTLHADMRAVVYRASEILRDTGDGLLDFSVGETDRTLERQRELVAAGSSATMNSRHLVKMLNENGQWREKAAAVDLVAIVGGKVSWDWKFYHRITKAMKQAADELGVQIDSGSNWKTFPDGPHHQLSWKHYPVQRVAKARHV